MKLLSTLFGLAYLTGFCSADADPTVEPSNSAVNVLTYSNYHRFLRSNTKDLVLMEFYAPWCGHCQQLAPEYRAAATEVS